MGRRFRIRCSRCGGAPATVVGARARALRPVSSIRAAWNRAASSGGRCRRVLTVPGIGKAGLDGPGYRGLRHDEEAEAQPLDVR
ncbi:MAG: hypothetical protein AVDCRST_MAG55-3364 [uncultured Rubrobacteraceae bacterium]|uniref:Uncharacterized protein n=1 Tax=uncultured Rubrobacteraceae bacterium TaxID=349277 RepID=A0A6J4QGN9_9ACTN|nr:MAG: hypothetical protein AVDCRST_MAG55-3364 [uncultured Rubrobacteraceae bacterium]